MKEVLGLMAKMVAMTAAVVVQPMKWLLNEAVMPAAEKLIPQGAAELAHSLFAGNGYVPYGPTESPVHQAQEPNSLAQMREEVEHEPEVSHDHDRGMER
jgi:hypothetical protein